MSRERYFAAIEKMPHLAGLWPIMYTVEDGRVSMSLESLEALAGLFQDSILYGLKRPENDQVFPLAGTPYEDASDIAEKSGCLLMFKVHTEWIES